MFLFGVGGSILPYIISIIAIWSGIWLGHAHLFRNTNNLDSVTTLHVEKETWLETTSTDTFQWSDRKSLECEQIQITADSQVRAFITAILVFYDGPPETLSRNVVSHKLRGPPSIL